MESLPLIDVSSEVDLLASPSSDGLSNCQSTGLSVNGVKNNCYKVKSVSVQEGESTKAMGKLNEHVPEKSESPEKKQTKYGKHHLRKSLAWDSAFFTDEGVLNTEELAIVNSTFRKTEASALTGIPEEVTKSTESISTLDSDSWALENLEVDLFANVRASIQMSLGKCDEAPNVGHSRNTKDQMVMKAPRLGLSKKAELSSQNKKIPSFATKGNGISKQLPDHCSKEAPVTVKVVPTGIADSKMLKIPRVVARATPPTVPSRAAIASGSTQMKGGNKGKSVSGNAVCQQSATNLNRINGDARSTTSKSMLSQKSTRSLVPVKAGLSTASCSLYSNSVNCSSDTRGKSLLENTRKRSASRNLDLTASGSIATRTPVRASKSRLVSRNTSNPLNVNVKVASSVSPSSSIDSLASESSSSTSTAKKPCSLVDSLDVRSSSSSSSVAGPPDSGMLQSSGLRKLSLDQSSVRNENSAPLLHKKCLKKEPSEIQPMSEPSGGDNSRNYTSSDRAAKSFKPSGLRMPTPKIGYFDAGARQQNFLKGSTTGVGNKDGTNKLRSSKLQYVRPATQNEAQKIDSPQTRSTQLTSHSTTPASPTLLQQPKRDVAFCFGSMTDSNHDSGSEVGKILSSQKSKDSQPEVFKVIAEVADKAEEQANQIPQKSMLTVFAVADGRCDTTSKFTQLSCHYSGPETLEKSSITQEGYVDKNLHLDTVIMEKENLFPVHRPVGLNEDLKTENLNIAMVDFVGEKIIKAAVPLRTRLSLLGVADVSTGSVSLWSHRKPNCLVRKFDSYRGLGDDDVERFACTRDSIILFSCVIFDWLGSY